MARVTGWLTGRGYPTGLARLYEALAAKTLTEFRIDAERFLESIEPYLKASRDTGMRAESFVYVPSRDDLEQVRSLSEAAGVSLKSSFDYAVQLLLGEYDWDAEQFLENLKRYAESHRKPGRDR